MKPTFITIPIVAYIYELTTYFVNKFFKAPDCISIGKICWAWIVSRIYIFPCLTLVTNWKHLSIKTTPYTLTSVCIFSLLFSIHFQRCSQGEFVQQQRATLVSGPLFMWTYCVIQGWYCKEEWDASHSQGSSG